MLQQVFTRSFGLSQWTSRPRPEPFPVLRHERDTETAELKQGKARYEVATGQAFDGPRYPLGALVFYKAKGDGLSEASTKPGILLGWHMSPGMK